MNILPRGTSSSSSLAPLSQPRPLVAASGSGVSAAEILASLRRWWWQCGICGVLLASGAAAIVFATFKPLYRATALVQIRAEPEYIAFPTRTEGRAFALNQLEMLRGPIVLSRVATDAAVRRVCEVPADEIEIWLARNVKASFVGSSEICQVSFTAENKDTAAFVANAIVAQYLSFHEDNENENTQRTIALLKGHQNERELEVEEIRDRVRTLSRQADEPLLAKGSNVVVRHTPADDVERRCVTAEADYDLLLARFQAAEERLNADDEVISREELVAAVNAHPEIVALREHVEYQTAQLANTKAVSKRGESDPVVVAKTKEVEAANARLIQRAADLEPAMESQWRRGRKAHYAASLATWNGQLRDKKLELDYWLGKLQEKRKRMEAQSDHALDLQFAQDDLERSQDVYTKIAARIVALNTEKSRPPRSFERFKAKPPLVPVELIPIKRLLPACVGGFCLPFGLAFLWERLARKVTDRHRLSAELELPVLAEIAALPTRRLAKGDRSPSFMRERVTFEESVDSLRVGLALSPDARDLRTLVVTSAVSGEGKTNLASSLAISLARATHERLLIIDADMRAPDLHEIFGRSLDPGLVEVLGEACPLELAIVQTDVPNIDFLPAGRLTVSPHFLLRGGALESLLAKLKGTYRQIIVDSPPVLTASEAVVIAHACDGVLICTRCDYSRGPQLRSAAERLLAAGARVLGAVISGVPTRTWAQRYGGYGYGWEKYAAAAQGQPHSDVDLTALALPAPDASAI